MRSCTVVFVRWFVARELCKGFAKAMCPADPGEKNPVNTARYGFRGSRRQNSFYPKTLGTGSQEEFLGYFMIFHNLFVKFGPGVAGGNVACFEILNQNIFNKITLDKYQNCRRNTML